MLHRSRDCLAWAALLAFVAGGLLVACDRERSQMWGVPPKRWLKGRMPEVVNEAKASAKKVVKRKANPLMARVMDKLKGIAAARQSYNKRQIEELNAAIGAMQRPLVDRALLDILTMNKGGMGPDAARAIGAFKEGSHVLPLVSALKGKDVFVAEASCQGLGKIKDPRAVTPLVDIVTSIRAQTIVRVACVDALASIGNIGAVPPLLELLKDQTQPEEVRGAAAVALGRLGDERAKPHLLPLLSDKEAKMRFKAATALKLLKAPESLPALAKLLVDGTEAIKREAVAVLRTVKDKPAMIQAIFDIFDRNPPARLDLMGPVKELCDATCPKIANERRKKAGSAIHVNAYKQLISDLKK